MKRARAALLLVLLGPLGCEDIGADAPTETVPGELRPVDPPPGGGGGGGGLPQCRLAISPGNQALESTYAVTWSCDRNKRDRFISDLGMDLNQWINFGGTEPCNLDLALGRFLNAVSFVDYFQNSFRGYGGDRMLTYRNMYVSESLPWRGYDYLRRIDGVTPECADVSQWASMNGVTHHMTARARLFFVGDVITRAATLIHEVRHTEGKVHLPASDCPAPGGITACDHHFLQTGGCITPWADDGGYSYGAKYLWDWAAQCRELCDLNRSEATLMQVQNTLNSKFSVTPTVRAWPIPAPPPPRPEPPPGRCWHDDGPNDPNCYDNNGNLCTDGDFDNFCD